MTMMMMMLITAPIVPHMNNDCTLSLWTSTSVKLSWTAATPAGSYTYIYNYGTGDVTANTGTYTADVTGLDGGANYVFTVRVINGNTPGNTVTCSGTTGM